MHGCSYADRARFSNSVSLPAPLNQATDTWPAPAPRVDEPVYVCQRTLHLTEMRAGASIVLRRGGGEDRACFGADEGFFTYGSGLGPKEEVALWQEFTAGECNLVGSPDSVRASTDPPAAPGFPYPICAGDRVVTVAGLVPGAIIELPADGVPLCEAGVSIDG